MSKSTQQGKVEVICNSCDATQKVESKELYSGKRCQCGGTLAALPQNKASLHKSSKERHATAPKNKSGKVSKADKEAKSQKGGKPKG